MRRFFIHYQHASTAASAILDDHHVVEKSKSKGASSIAIEPVKEKKSSNVEGYCKNSVKAIRESLLMSKAELARKAGLSVLTVSRIENGIDCRMDTKRKIILALGLTLADKEKVFEK